MPLRVKLTCPHCGASAYLELENEGAWRCAACNNSLDLPSEQSTFIICSDGGEKVLRLAKQPRE